MIWKNEFTIEQLEEISNNTLVSHLGIRFTKIGDNFITATMPVDERTIQPMGILHGGSSVALAETLGSVAAISCVDTEKNSVVGVEINANHLKSVRFGEIVTGKVSPIRIGKKIHVWEIEIRNHEDEMICIARITIMVIPLQ